MIWYFLFKGLFLGMTIAAIGGPISILCIRQTIKEGLLAGIAIGFGAASADALFGSIAGFGITIISDFLLYHQKIINLIGGSFLIYLGIVTFFERPEEKQSHAPKIKRKGAVANAITSFLITLANPATILFFSAVAVSSSTLLTNYLAVALLISGIFIGSLLVFSSLALLVTIFQTKITSELLIFMNKIFGIGLIVFGIYVGIRSF